MALTESERQFIDKFLSENEKKNIESHLNEMQAIYDFIEKSGLHKPFMEDCERFIGFTFMYTKQLVKHSITLGNLTKWLIGLTIALVGLTIANIVIILIV